MMQFLSQMLIVFFAASSNALCYTIAFHGGGIFHGQKGFDINKQGKFLPFTKYPLDAFHLSQSVMIISFIMLGITNTELPNLLDVIVLGVWYNVVFNFFFNHIFK